MKHYFSSMKQYSWIVLACVLLATIAGLLLARTQPTVYQVSSTIFVNEGAPGVTYPGGPTPGTTAADSLSQAMNYAAEIPTRSVMQYVIKFDPQLQRRGYNADDLMLDIIPSTSTTASTISLLATTTHPGDSVLVANDVAKGFAAYTQAQSQQHLNTVRQGLINQINTLQQQKQHWEGLLTALPNTTVPQYGVYNNNLSDTTHNLDTVQAQLQALPVTVNGDVSVIQLAAPKDVTTTPKGLIIIGVTAGVGLLVGILIMLLVIFLDNRLRSDQQVNEKLGLAYLGGLSNSNEFKEIPTSLTGAALQEVSDIYANLRLTGILPAQWQAPQGVVLLVTSPKVAEGKTTVATALATAVARSGGSVIIVDGNLQQPSTHLAFGMKPAGIGLSGLLKGAGSVDDAVLRSNVPGVWLLPAGAVMDDATLLIGQRMPAILMQLRQKIDLVIIDGPALLSSAEASQLANMADGVALVSDTRHDKLSLLARARDLLTSLTHTPVGIIMNRLAGKRRNRYFATAYSTNAPVGKWAPVQVYASNGNESGDGLRQEAIPAGRASILAPSSMPVSPAQSASTLRVVPQELSNGSSSHDAAASARAASSTPRSDMTSSQQ